ncbi:MAG TPA: HAD-IIIC family phosphatase [Blastocatellia bacterium]|nr:HAD-IIIC family phosphatase [Blastocatellia bacterium]
MTKIAKSRSSEKDETKYVKCLVWDLDNTLWSGVLLEDRGVELRDNVTRVIKELDGRGILQSIASKNDPAKAMAKLDELGLGEYFLYPQVNWNSKASSIKEIARLINIGLDTVAFIDDDPFERGEVNHQLPDVLCVDAGELDGLLDRAEMNPRFITEDSKQRRLLYFHDIERKKAEEEFIGPKDEFLATLGMKFSISRAREEDLRRAEELTLRTHQLNTTGYTYSYDELKGFLESDRHRLLIAGLEDKYGSYGKIGLALIECDDRSWTLKLLLMSCRVMSRGVGTIMLNHVMALAKRAGCRLFAEFIPNEVNRLMYVTYKFAGFRESQKVGEKLVLENDLTRIQPAPDYVTLLLDDHG